MKYLLVLILGFGTFSIAACKSTTAEMQSTDAVMLNVTGMT